MFIAIMGAVVPNIDQAAHLGGLTTGFVVGLLLFRASPVVTSKWVAMRRDVTSLLVAAALAGAAAFAGKCRGSQFLLNGGFSASRTRSPRHSIGSTQSAKPFPDRGYSAVIARCRMRV